MGLVGRSRQEGLPLPRRVREPPFAVSGLDRVRGLRYDERCPEVEVGSPKQTVLEMIQRLPDDASLEDIQYHLFVLQKIERGLDDAEAGRVIPQEEVEKRLEKWLGR